MPSLSWRTSGTGVFNTVDYQFIADPGDNAARGPVSVVSLRLHVQQVAGHD